MPTTKSTALLRLCVTLMLLFVPILAGHASVRVHGPAEFASYRVTCELPIRLTHDCSIWQGATRPIAFGDYRMSLAAGSGGRTILLSRLRRAPSHNGGSFRFEAGEESGEARSEQAIRLIGEALGEQGIRLEGMRPVHRGPRVDGYFLQFSDNAYDYLKQFTVLESEYWLPKRRREP